MIFSLTGLVSSLCLGILLPYLAIISGSAELMLKLISSVRLDRFNTVAIYRF